VLSSTGFAQGSRQCAEHRRVYRLRRTFPWAAATLLSNQQTTVTPQVQQMTHSVQLIEALGGGWTTSQLPSEKEVAAKRP
jgi:hypothetical protein